VSIKKERQLVGILKKYTLKKFSSNSKEENKLEILQFLSNLKEKKTRVPLIFIWMTKITTKMFSVLIAYRKLKDILFFFFKFDKTCKIFSLFSSFELDENFLNVHFFEMATCFSLLSLKTYFHL
jgi:hypothetical protein